MYYKLEGIIRWKISLLVHIRQCGLARISRDVFISQPLLEHAVIVMGLRFPDWFKKRINSKENYVYILTNQTKNREGKKVEVELAVANIQKGV